MPKSSITKAKDKDRLPLEIRVLDKKGCPFYLGRAFNAVNVKESPGWLQKTLTWMGQKSINNVVDITNHCLYELGQPLHAFDYDKINGAKIVVRRAKKGEKILALNGIEYELDERILVIADAVKPIAIAGVIGGAETEVTASTKRVVLESAQFDPILIRRASRFLKVMSESSYRFERTVNPYRVKEGSLRAASLMEELSDARPASGLIERGYLKLNKKRRINLRLFRVYERLGYNIPQAKIVRILSSLGFKVKKAGKTALKIKTLMGRSDVKEEADLIEEITRIEGFDKIPIDIPVTRHGTGLKDDEEEYKSIRSIKNNLTAQGFNEVITLSLLSGKHLEDAGWPMDLGAIKVTNPLSQEQEFLRPSGLMGLLGVISRNVNRKIKDLSIFEVGKRFVKDAEENVLSIAATGALESSWENKKESSFYVLKGVIENCFKILNRQVPAWIVEEYLKDAFRENISLFWNKNRLATCSTLQQSALKKWDILHDVFFAEINLDLLLKMSVTPRMFEPLPKFPSVKRDISFLIEDGKSVQDINALIEEEGKPFLKTLSLFDQYIGKNLPQNKRSLAFTMEYQKPDATFTDDEIQILHNKIVRSLKTNFQIELR